MVFDFSKEPGQKLLNRYIIKEMKPLISIITPYYNAGKYFEQTYKSILNQTFPFFEWIIVNDGSTNGSDVELLEKLALRDCRIKVYHTSNAGASAARNYAVKKTKCDFFVPIDADDLIEPTYIEMLYFAILYNKDVSWAFSDSVGFGELEYTWNHKFSSDTMKKMNVITSTAMIRKKDFEEVEGFIESSKNLYEDWRLWLKFLAKEKFPIQINEYLFWYRRSDEGALAKIHQNESLKKKVEQEIELLAAKIENKLTAVNIKENLHEQFCKPNTSEWKQVLPFAKKKVRILLLIPHMVMGGADKVNIDIIENIDKNKYEISIITTVASENEWIQRFRDSVVDIFNLPNFLEMKHWPEFIDYFIKSRDIDIILNSNSYYGYYLLPWIRQKFPKVAILDYNHMEEEYWRKGGYPRISSTLDYFLDMSYCENEYTRNVMISKYGKIADKIKTIYLGVDTNYYSPELFDKTSLRNVLDIPVDNFVILFLCRLHPQKRPFLMVEIAKELISKHRNATFLVVGDGPDESEIKGRISKYGLWDNFLFVGRKSDTRPYYAVSDVSLICSIKEGLTLTAFEAMSMGVPVITSDVGGQKELVDDATGQVIPCLQDEKTDFDNRGFSKKEITLYVNAIGKYIEKPNYLKTLSINARGKIVDGFTIENFITSLQNVFDLSMQKEELDKRYIRHIEAAKLGIVFNEMITIYASYEALAREAAEIWNSKLHFENLCNQKCLNRETKNNDVEFLQSEDEISARERLNQIYSTRSWKVVQKYQALVSNNSIVRFIRSLFIKKNN